MTGYIFRFKLNYKLIYWSILKTSNSKQRVGRKHWRTRNFEFSKRTGRKYILIEQNDNHLHITRKTQFRRSFEFPEFLQKNQTFIEPVEAPTLLILQCYRNSQVAAVHRWSIKLVIWNISLSSQGSEFSSYEIELRNQITQNDVTHRVTNSKMFIEILLSSY